MISPWHCIRYLFHTGTSTGATDTRMALSNRWLLHHVGNCLHLPAEPHFNLKIMWGNNAINHPPNHHFCRWYVDHSQENGWFMALFYPHYINEIQVHNLNIFQLCGNMPYWISTYFVKCWFHEFHVLPQGPCSKVFFWRDFTSWSDQNRPVAPIQTHSAWRIPLLPIRTPIQKVRILISIQMWCHSTHSFTPWTFPQPEFMWTSSNSNPHLCGVALLVFKRAWNASGLKEPFKWPHQTIPSSIFQWKTIYIAIVKSSLSDLIDETTIETTLAPSLQNHSSDSPSLAHLFCLFIVAIAWLKRGHGSCWSLSISTLLFG